MIDFRLIYFYYSKSGKSLNSFAFRSVDTNLGRTLLASSSGALVEWLNDDWSVFFFITSAMVIPSLIFLWFIRKKINLGGK